MLDKFGDRARETGNVIDAEMIAKLRTLDERLDLIKAKWSGFVLNIKMKIAGGVAAVPVKGSPLHAQVEQRARARLAECRRHLGLPSAEGEGAMGETVTAMSTS